MSLLCNNNCASPTLPTALDPCDLSPVQTSGLFFIFIACDYQFTDITDLLEWQAAITAGNIVGSPCGFWGSALPAQTNFDISCGKKFQVQEGRQFAFTGSEINATDLSDQNFYKSIRDNYKRLKVIPVTCDGQFLVTDAYVSAITSLEMSPGFDFTWIVPPDYEIVSGENNLMTWQFTLQIATNDIICRRYLTGVKELFDK
jgi:hypothetical protein